ncbi:MAG: YidC/Oxa1 family membrane protein insertase [Clostridia bacterium]|nr:YidC/Oxa1 family membrane protein insertase [Clostridia bacterium]
MQALFNIINIPFSYVLQFISDIFGGNFAAAVFVFTLLINLAFIPITIKSQKSAVQQLRIKPKLDALKEKYGDDKQKYSMAMQELYQKEGVSMSGGCLPMILRLLIMMSIYWMIMQPLTYLLDIDAGTMKAAVAALKDLGENVVEGRSELQILGAVNAGKINFPEIAEAAKDMSFSFFGIDLTATPKFNIDIFSHFNRTWIMPLLAFASQMLSSVMSSAMQKKQNPDAPSMMGMMLTMPLISLFIGFGFPCGVTFYWACSSLIGGVIQILVQQFYGPHKLLSKERTKQLSKQCDFEETQIKKFGQIEE